MKKSANNSIIFFGTSEFAAPVLKLLVKEDWPIKLVVTQPDEPVGRRQKLQPPPVKAAARELGLKIVQPANLDQELRIKDYELSVVCAYGKLLPKKLLDLPKYGSLNIHPSLLPKYRGASPIQTALLNGDKETGVSLMLLDEKMDHGPILAQEKIKIESDEIYPVLSKKLAQAGAELLLKTLPDYLAGELKPKPQDDSEATYTKILKREDGKIDWRRGAQEIYNQWRALVPWPGTHSELGIKNPPAGEAGQKLRIKLMRLRLGGATKKQPGEIFTENKKLAIACGDGQSVEILELQPEGKKPLTAAAFINGYLKN